MEQRYIELGEFLEDNLSDLKPFRLVVSFYESLQKRFGHHRDHLFSAETFHIHAGLNSPVRHGQDLALPDEALRVGAAGRLQMLNFARVRVLELNEHMLGRGRNIEFDAHFIGHSEKQERHIHAIAFSAVDIAFQCLVLGESPLRIVEIVSEGPSFVPRAGLVNKRLEGDHFFGCIRIRPGHSLGHYRHARYPVFDRFAVHVGIDKGVDGEFRVGKAHAFIFENRRQGVGEIRPLFGERRCYNIRENYSEND